MLQRGLTAAGLLVVAVAFVAGGRAQPAHTSTVEHTCGALDREFVRVAALGNTALALLGQSLVRGDMTPAEALAETRDAAARFDETNPRDPSLRLARSLMHGMVVEYGRAIRAAAKGDDAGRHMYRSYTLANYAHQVLSEADAALAAQGCPVADLLQQ